MATKKVSFHIWGDNDKPGPLVTGSRVAYGLVLHRPAAASHIGWWVVSEPFTGMKVCGCAGTRQDCLRLLVETAESMEIREGVLFDQVIAKHRDMALRRRGLVLVERPGCSGVVYTAEQAEKLFGVVVSEVSCG